MRTRRRRPRAAARPCTATCTRAARASPARRSPSSRKRRSDGRAGHGSSVTETTLGGHLRFRSAIAVLVVCTAVLAACGGDDDDSSDAGATTPSTATPTLPSTTTTTSPPSPYKATVTPSSGLTDGQEVTVT